MSSWSPARIPLTPGPVPTRRSTGSAGSVSRPLMLTGMDRSPTLSLPPCSMLPPMDRKDLDSQLPSRPLPKETNSSPRWTRTVTVQSLSTNGSPCSSRRSFLLLLPFKSEQTNKNQIIPVAHKKIYQRSSMYLCKKNCVLIRTRNRENSSNSPQPRKIQESNQSTLRIYLLSLLPKMLTVTSPCV